MTTEKKYHIRRALPDDVESVAILIHDLARYEKSAEQCKVTKERLLDDCFGSENFIVCLVAEVSKDDDTRKIVGFCIYFYAYSAWEGRLLYVEDVFVTPDHRRHGIAKRLFHCIAKDALKNRCCRIEFAVLNWNLPAIKFYRTMEANDWTEKEGRNLWRINARGLNMLTSTLQTKFTITSQYAIREAIPADCAGVTELIQEQAAHHECSSVCSISEKRVLNDFFGPEKCATCLVAETFEKDGRSKLVGHCIYLYAYSTWEGRFMYIEDIFVRPDHRLLGIGKAFFSYVAKVAADNLCCRMHFIVLEWNKPAIEFYNKVGAYSLTEREGWHVWHIDASCVECLANACSCSNN